MKKLFLIIGMISILGTSSGFVHAATENHNNLRLEKTDYKNKQTQVSELEGYVKYQTPEKMKNAMKNDSRIEGQLEYNFYDSATNQIDKKKLKQSLLGYYEKDPSTFAPQIKDIDNIVENAVVNSNINNMSGAQSSQSEVSPLAYIEIYNGWIVEPYLDSAQDWVTWTTSWLTEDNYRSSVPITTTSTKSSKVSTQIGFDGSVKIKEKFGFRYSYAEEQTTTVSIGAIVPGWTVWGYRPYIRYTVNQYYGMYRVQYLDTLTGKTVTSDTVHSGTDNVLKIKSNEYWSAKNTAENPNAMTPIPPAGQPGTW